MKIVGLTGGIGSGKSTVLEQFKNLGIDTYSADKAAKKLINSDDALIKSIKKIFGDNIYENNILNTVKLSKIVFNDKRKLELLNSIVHPAVTKDFESFVKTNNGDYIVKEVAIIFETNTQDNYDKIILVRAPIEDRIKRVVLRDNISEFDVTRRVYNQFDDSSIIDRCDYTIDNINITDLKEKVIKIHKDLIIQ
tara:strand:- start:19373 stop:19954 length:582 start_codon:yes stop_codon:yes gene_type:complete